MPTNAYMLLKNLPLLALSILGATASFADIGIISPGDAKKLIDDSNPEKRPIVLDTRGGYKDYFRGHLPTALCYCGTSREGSLLRFYLKHVAGYPNVRLYEGAWKEYVWLKGKSLPAETTESKAK